VRRCRVVVRWRGRIRRGRDQLEPSGRRSRRRRKLVRRLVEYDAVEPDHVIVVVRELREIGVAGRRRVWLQMPMRSRVGVVGIGLVDMLRRQRRQGEIGHQDQADDGAAERRLHVQVIMVMRITPRQTKVPSTCCRLRHHLNVESITRFRTDIWLDSDCAEGRGPRRNDSQGAWAG